MLKITAIGNLRFDEKSETFLCLFVTSRDEIGGLLIEADGFDYARYAAFIPDKKALALDGIPVERANEKCLRQRSAPER